MKKHYLLFLLVLFGLSKTYAQNPCINAAPCIFNSGTDASVPVVRGVTPVGTNIPGWNVLSGTPLIQWGEVNSTGIGLTNGQGVYACYGFQQGSEYRLCLRGYNLNAIQGNLIVEISDGTTTTQVGTFGYLQNGVTFNLPEVSFSFFAGFTANQVRFRVANNSNYYISIDDIGIIEVPQVAMTKSEIMTCESTTITATTHNPDIIIDWFPSTGLNTTRGNTVIASPCETTTYTLRYRPRNCFTFTCWSFQETVTVVVKENGKINNYSSPNCEDSIKLEYEQTLNCGGTNTYRWFYSNDPVPIGNQKIYFRKNLPQNKQGPYWVEVTFPNGCKDSFYTTVIQNCCEIFADFEPDGCNPIRFENTTLDKYGDTALTGQWHWDFGNGKTSNLRNPSHLFTPNLGIHEVCLTAIITDGYSTCCDKICKEIDACDYGCAPKAAIDYLILNPITGEVQFFDRTTGQGSASQWIWTISKIVGGVPTNTVSTNLQNPLMTLSGPGIYEVCLDVSWLDILGLPCGTDLWCEKFEIK